MKVYYYEYNFLVDSSRLQGLVVAENEEDAIVILKTRYPLICFEKFTFCEIPTDKAGFFYL